MPQGPGTYGSKRGRPPFKLKSGNSVPFKQMGSIDPLDLGLIDEAKKVTVKKPISKPYEFKTSTKKVPKIKDVTGKKLTNIVLKGDKLPIDKITKKHASQKALKDANKKAIQKKVKKKAIKKVAGQIAKKAIPAVAVATTIYDVGKFAKDWIQTGDIEQAWDKNKWWGGEKGNLFKKDDK